MAFGNINPYFLPWQHQGVDFLLADEAVPAGLSLCHAPAQPMQKTAPHRATSTQRYSAVTPQPQSQTQASGSAAHGLTAVRQAPTPPAPSALPIRAQDTPKHALQETSRPTMPPMEHLPHLWQERLQATKPNAVLWTYWSLGYDLCGYPSDARRALLKKIIVDDLQQGFKDYSLWPCALPDTAAQNTGVLPELLPHAQAFWTGVQRLHARGLVIFGSAAAKAVGLQKEAKPAKFINHNGCRVLFINDIDYLVENSSYYQSMLASLKPFLKQFLHW